MVNNKLANACVASIPWMSAKGVSSSYQSYEGRRAKAAIDNGDDHEESDPMIDICTSLRSVMLSEPTLWEVEFPAPFFDRQ
jgi:hypothetical protein